MVANHRVDFVCVKSIHRLLFQEYFIKASMPALNNWPDCWHTTMLFSLFDFCAVRLAQKDCSQLPLQWHIYSAFIWTKN